MTASVTPRVCVLPLNFVVRQNRTSKICEGVGDGGMDRNNIKSTKQFQLHFASLQYAEYPQYSDQQYLELKLQVVTPLIEYLSLAMAPHQKNVPDDVSTSYYNVTTEPTKTASPVIALKHRASR
jgi:hypothetical protein